MFAHIRICTVLWVCYTVQDAYEGPQAKTECQGGFAKQIHQGTHGGVYGRVIVVAVCMCVCVCVCTRLCVCLCVYACILDSIYL